MIKKLLAAFFIWVCGFGNGGFAQNRNNVWCFGDSAGIDFSSGTPVTFASGMDGRGSCVSISDTSGQLQFYANTRAGLTGNTTLVWNKNHQLMQNGDSIVGEGWYNELVIVPYPSSDSLYYIFSIGLLGSSQTGTYYSIIDLSANGGLGDVIQKNIQLQSFQEFDCLNAIKHGNGRDWWVFFKKWNGNLTANNKFHSYLITPSGVTNHSTQNVGSGSWTNLGKLTFSAQGDRLAFVSYAGLMEIYDFDRCTGLISNPINIFQESINPPYNNFWGCEFSPNGNMLYVTISDQTSYLFQLDLTAANIAASIETLRVATYPQESIGELKRGPDGKIYESGPYVNPSFYNYPYPDSVYNMYNMNLGVINSPDSLGTACDFQPYSFYLGGKRTYWGLPNNPDYDMPALAGSPCDSLTGITNNEQGITKGELFVYYHPGWEIAFINAKGLRGKKYAMVVVDVLGKINFKEEGKLTSEYFTKDLHMQSFSKGMYVVSLEIEKEKLVKKFVKQ